MHKSRRRGSSRGKARARHWVRGWGLQGWVGRMVVLGILKDYGMNIRVYVRRGTLNDETRVVVRLDRRRRRCACVCCGED